MCLMYVDESGDSGIAASPTNYFCLSGLVVHEICWRELMERLVEFRRRMKIKYSLGVRDEIHAAEFIRGSAGKIMRRHERLNLLKNFADELAGIDYISITNVVVDKRGKASDYPVFERAWQALFQRFENTLNYRNFPGPQNADDKGLVICDNTDGGRLTSLMRKMGAYNPIPNQDRFGPGSRNQPIKSIIEDPHLRDSKASLLIQASDLSAYLLYQYHEPNSYFRHKGEKNLFKRLEPILNKRAATRHPLGIVIL
jgi:hypothetical protein